MRILNKKEMKKRGCVYCTDHRHKRHGCLSVHFCDHNKCPYHELDKYKSYGEYLEAEGGGDFFDILLNRKK